MDSRWLVAPLLSTLIAFNVYADEEYWEEENLESALDGDIEQVSYEDENDPLPFLADASDNTRQSSGRTSKDPFPSQSSSGEMFASAMPTLEHGWGIIFFGDWIFWKAEAEGFEYGLQSLNHSDQFPFASNNGQGDPFKGVRGKLSRTHSEYESGYRLGMDIKTLHDSWDVLGQWTRLHSNSSGSIGQKSDQIVWPFYLNNLSIPKALSAKARWELSYSVLDIELGRSFFVAKHLSLRPFVGFKAAWIEQEFTADYFDIFYVQSQGGPSLSRLRSHNHNKFKGYGMEAGIETKWPLVWGFSLQGNFAAALLFSDFEIGQFEKDSAGNPRTVLKDDIHLTAPVIEMFGGIAWERQFYKKKCYLNLHAGWEEQVWFRQNQLNLFLFTNGFSNSNIGETVSRAGNLTLSGWTVGAKFGF